jgi:general secretion pathway protein D
MAHICHLVRQLDVPTPLVLLEVKVLSIDLGEDFNSIFDYQFATDNLLAGGFTSGNILPPLADIGAPAPPRYLPINPQGTGIRPTDFIFQVVNSNFRFRMQVLEVHNRVTEVATPVLLTANNEVSRIFIGQTQPITIGFTPGQIVNTGVATASTLSPTPITTLQDIGTQLVITPNINADRTVTLRLTEQRSSVVPNGGTIPVPNATGGIQNIAIDIVRRQTFTGTVVAKDGLTVAVGGLIEEELRDHREEPPIISKIPYLGFLFRRQTSRRGRREHVILIRPYVFFTPVEAAALSRDLVSDLSAHPMAPAPIGTLNTFLPREVLRPDPPKDGCETIFKVHFFTPKDF